MSYVGWIEAKRSDRAVRMVRNQVRACIAAGRKIVTLVVGDKELSMSAKKSESGGDEAGSEGDGAEGVAPPAKVRNKNPASIAICDKQHAKEGSIVRPKITSR